MENKDLAYEGARGIGQTGIEGGYGSVSCSTAGDYPSMGISQWEGLDGGRGDSLLSSIDGGQYYVGRSYSDIEAAEELDSLGELLDSPEGQEAQNQLLAADCLAVYVPALKKVSTLDDTRCFIYAMMWCPTSHNTVRAFLQNREDRVNLRDLNELRKVFEEEYYIAADVGEQYAAGYANRANNTFDYVSSLDLETKYGIPAYGGGNE